MQDRLIALKRELEIGQHELEKLERQRVSLRETMLRIAGAIQVLEELLTDGPENGRERTYAEGDLAMSQSSDAGTGNS
jgi:hypothetical protein